MSPTTITRAALGLTALATLAIIIAYCRTGVVPSSP